MSNQYISDPKTGEKLEKLMQEPELTSWEKQFLASVHSFDKRYGKITIKQDLKVKQIAKRHSPEEKARYAEWRENFTDEMKQRVRIAANYYKGSGYFKNQLTRIEGNQGDDALILSPNAYKAFCENKYIKKVYACYFAEPAFDIGDIVQVRNVAKLNPAIRNKTALVLEHPETGYKSAKGGRPYVVFELESEKKFTLHERDLKKPRFNT